MQLVHGLPLNLANPLLGNAQLLADFLQGMTDPVLHAEVKPQHLLLPGIQSGKELDNGVFQLLAHKLLIGLRGQRILHQIAQDSVVPFSRGHIQRAHVRGQEHQLLHPLLRKAAPPGNLSGGRLLTGFLGQCVLGRRHRPHFLRGMQRHPDGTAVVDKAPGHALANPLRGVGGKPAVHGIVEFPGCRQQTDASLLDQVKKGDSPLRSSEAKAAVAVGKKLKKAKLSLTREKQVWSGTFDADQFAFGSFKLPEGDALTNEDEIFAERVQNLIVFREAMTLYFRKFAETMMGLEFPKFENEIREWAKNRDAI